LEVIYALAEQEGVTPQQLEKIREAKVNKRGAFTQRIILEETS